MMKYFVIICLLYCSLFHFPQFAEAAGDSPATNCVSALSVNIIEVTIQFIICHLSGIFDTYIAQTPNLLSENNQLAKRFNEELFFPLRKISINILTLSLIVLIGYTLIKTALLVHTREDIFSLFGQFLLHYFFILVLPVLYSLWIDLNNAVCSLIMQSIAGSNSLSTVIVLQMHLADSSLLPSLGNTILWILLLVSLLFIIFFFILRFILIWLFFLILPFFIAIGMLPYAKSMLDGVITKVFQFTLVQPVFLLGVGIFLLIVPNEQDIITRYLLGIASLMSLAAIPSIFAGISGGKLLNVSNHYVEDTYHAITHKISGGLHWIDDKLSEPYEMPLEKPDK